jgi:hypothetical protein
VDSIDCLVLHAVALQISCRIPGHPQKTFVDLESRAHMNVEASVLRLYLSSCHAHCELALACLSSGTYSRLCKSETVRPFNLVAQTSCTLFLQLPRRLTGDVSKPAAQRSVRHMYQQSISSNALMEQPLSLNAMPCNLCFVHHHMANFVRVNSGLLKVFNFQPFQSMNRQTDQTLLCRLWSNHRMALHMGIPLDTVQSSLEML